MPDDNTPDTFQAPSLGIGALSRPQNQRPGWSFELDGEYLDGSLGFWTPDQLERGIAITCLEPTPQDQQLAANDSIAAGGSGGGIMMAIRASGAKRAIYTIDGKPIDPTDRDAIWRALGPRGRNEAQDMYDEAMKVSPKAKERAKSSFRRVI